MAEVTNRAGLGQDGYLQYQAETTYGTASSGSEIDLPIKEGTEFTAYPANIENANIISSRLMQDPQKGQITVEGQIVMDGWPTLIGDIITLFLGDASGSSAVGDGAFNSHWFIPKSGFSVGKSSTIYQAMGALLADRLTGVVFDSLTINQDNAGNVEMTIAYRGQNYTEDIARETTFSFPASSTNPPFMFGHASITAVPSGGDQVTLCADSLSITINLNHKLDRYKVCSTASGATISQPVFNSIPSVEVSMNVDADQYAIEYARNHTKWDLTIDWTHSTSQAGSTPTYHNFAVELPGSRLDPATTISNSNDYMNMDLTFQCSYGGTTTNSGTDEYMGELRLTDATDRS